jgi:hypothetical protein
MATDTMVQQQRQAPFIEKRSEQLLASVFGDPNAVQTPGESDAAFQYRKFGLSGVQNPVPGQQLAGFTAPQTQAFNLAQQGIGGYADQLAKAGSMTDMGGITSALAGTSLAGGTDKFDPSMADPYMNKYNEFVTAEIQRQGDMADGAQLQLLDQPIVLEKADTITLTGAGIKILVSVMEIT